LRLKIIYPVIIVVVFALDQAVKFVIRSRFDPRDMVVVIKSFFHIVYVRNTGMLFGLGDSSFLMRYHVHTILAIATLVFIIVIVRGYPPTAKWIHLGFALVIGGALGNLYDRLVLGYVVDFLEFKLYWFWWPAFNVADAAITVGIAMMAVQLLWLDREKTQAADPKEG
jgi:signal peptidase II